MKFFPLFCHLYKLNRIEYESHLTLGRVSSFCDFYSFLAHSINPEGLKFQDNCMTKGSFFFPIPGVFQDQGQIKGLSRSVRTLSLGGSK